MTEAWAALVNTIAHLKTHLLGEKEFKLYNLISDVSPYFKLNERTSSILITLGRISVSQRSEMLYQKFISFFY